MEKIFFELIRVAIGAQVSISRLPSEKEWSDIYKIAEKQSLIGICFAGLQRLGADADDGYARIGMSEMQYLNWMGMTARIKIRNLRLDQQCAELQEKLLADGIRSCILKGQGIGQLYIEHLQGLRQPGDIDIYVDCSREKAIAYAHSIQGKVDWDYKHLHLNIFKDTPVEMHYVPEISLNLIKNKIIQSWFKEHHEQFFTSGDRFITPSIDINLIYILLHTYRHFLYEGVGFRQLMDYYFVLSNPKLLDSTRQNAVAIIKKFGMLRFSEGVMWIMREVFGLDEASILCEPNEKEGRFILESVIDGGNFGKYRDNVSLQQKGKFWTVWRVFKHDLQLFTHYPADPFWVPIYFVWHKLWKFYNR